MSININSYIEHLVDEYKDFVGITTFPEYQLRESEIIVGKTHIWAQASYKFEFQKYILTVDPEIINHKADYKIYHELTHILDIEEYCKDDREKYICDTGCTEFHASQVELMKMIGAKSLRDSVAFSVSDKIQDLEEKLSIREFVLAPYKDAINILEQGIPTDFGTCKVLFDLIFYYFGRRSICEIYATDYEGSIGDITELLNLSEKYNINKCILSLNNLLNQWLDKAQIEKVNKIYRYEIFPVLSRLS